MGGSTARKPGAGKASDSARSGREEERRLLEAARAGDPRALQRLLERMSPPIYRFGRGFCRDTEDAKDVMQEVLVSLVRSLPSIRGDSPLSTWAYTVARRACSRQRRRRDRGLGPEAGGDDSEGRILNAPDPGPDPVRALEERELEAAVREAILSLPPAQREAVLLRDLEGQTSREAARVLRISERTLKSRLHRARLAIRDALAPRLFEGSSPPSPGRCPDAGRLLSRYLEGELTPSACAAMETHVRSCMPCGRACRALKRSLALCHRVGSRPLPAGVREELRRTIRSAVQEYRFGKPVLRS